MPVTTLTTVNQEARRAWYAFTPVLFEMAKQLGRRYLSCKREIDHKTIFTRYYSGYVVGGAGFGLVEALNRLGVKERPSKLYYDLAVFRMASPFSWDVKVRAEQKAAWEAGFEREFLALDFPIDLDGERWETAYHDAVKLKRLFDSDDSFLVRKYGRKPIYSLRFSGSKGFHFVIRHDYFKELRGRPSKEWVDHHIKLAQELEYQLGLKHLDYAVYDADRVFALPYALSMDDLVVLPLTDDEFERFSVDLVRPENVLRRVKIMNRGVLWRHEAA